MSILDPLIRRTSPLSMRLVVTCVGLLALVGAAVQIQAQAPAQTAATMNVKFDVASIKRNREAEAEREAVPAFYPVVPGRAQTLPGGLMLGKGMSVRELIRDAYGYRNRAHSEIVGAPDWVDKERYDVQAKASYEFPMSTSSGLPPAGEAALRALLAERFNLKVHLETQQRPVYELVMHRPDGRLGPNLKVSKGGCRPFFQREPVNTEVLILAPKDGEPVPTPPCGLSVAPVGIFTTNMSMTDFAKLMALRPQLNRTVIDRTGLTGGFDIQLSYPFDGASGPNPVPPMKPLLESQLGLTLREAEGPVEILVIETIEHPTEN